MKQTRKPTHPGALLHNLILIDRGIPIDKAAIAMGIELTYLNEFLQGNIKCDYHLAVAIANFCGTSYRMWLRMQDKLNLWEDEEEIRLELEQGLQESKK